MSATLSAMIGRPALSAVNCDIPPARRRRTGRDRSRFPPPVEASPPTPYTGVGIPNSGDLMAPDEAAKEEAGRKEDPPAPVPVAPVIPPPPAPGWVAPPMRRVLPATTPSAAPPPESSASSPASPSAGARDAGLQTRPADRLDRPASRPASRASWLLLPVLVLLGAGGYWLWQQGRFQPLLSLAQPLMASIGLPAGAAPREAPPWS